MSLQLVAENAKAVTATVVSGTATGAAIIEYANSANALLVPIATLVGITSGVMAIRYWYVATKAKQMEGGGKG